MSITQSVYTDVPVIVLCSDALCSDALCWGSCGALVCGPSGLAVGSSGGAHALRQFCRDFNLYNVVA